MAKTPKKPTKPNQTKSATTSAAQTIFNAPDQPVQPITTDNLANTISTAVNTAFAEKEKKEMSDLKKVQSKKPATNNGLPPGTKKVSDKELIDALIREPSIRKALSSVGLNESSRGTVKRAKKLLYDYAAQMLEEKTSAPKETEKKLIPNKDTKKPKRKSIVKDENGKTPTGKAINQIAELIAEKEEKTTIPYGFQKKNPISYNYPIMGKTLESSSDKNKLIVATPPITPLGLQAAKVLEDKSERVKKSEEPLALPAPTPIMSEKVKVEKSGEYEKDPKFDRVKNKQDVIEALTSLGFKKKEFNDLLLKVEHVENTTEQIRLLLKLLDKSNRKEVKIPKKEMPKAIQEAKESAGDRIASPSESPKEPAKPKLEKVSSDPDEVFKDKLDALLYSDSRKTKFETVSTPKSKATNAQPDKMQTEPKAKTVGDMTQEELLAMITQVRSESDQKKAEEDRAREAEEKRKRLEEEREKKVLRTLDEIKKKLANNGLTDLIALAIGALAGKLAEVMAKIGYSIYKFAIESLKKGVKIIWDAAKNLFSSIKNLFKDSEKDGAKAAEKVGEQVTEKDFAKEGEKVAAEEAAKTGGKDAVKLGAKDGGKFLLKKIPIIGAIAGLGFAAYDLIEEGDAKGAALDAASGLLSTIPFFGTAASVAVDAYSAGRDLGLVGDKAGDIAKSKKDDSDHLQDMIDAMIESQGAPRPPPVVQAPTSTKEDPSVLIKVRNDEPSSSGLISSMFDHPVSYGGVFRM